MMQKASHGVQPHPLNFDEDQSYFEHLMDIDLFTTPADIGDPGAEDGVYPDDQLNKPVDFIDHGVEWHEDEAEEDEGEETPEEELEEEEDRGPTGYGADPHSDREISLDQNFILNRGMPDGYDSVSQDDTSEPVRPDTAYNKPLQEPGPDPHFNTLIGELMLDVLQLKQQQQAIVDKIQHIWFLSNKH